MDSNVRISKKRPIGMFSARAWLTVGCRRGVGCGLVLACLLPSRLDPQVAVPGGADVRQPATTGTDKPIAPHSLFASGEQPGDGGALPSAGGPVAELSATPTGGRVVGVGAGYALVNLGTADGLREGERLILRDVDRRTLTQRAAPRSVIGVITALEPHRLRVELGVNEWVEVGYRVLKTGARATASRNAPPPPRSDWSFSVNARPFLPVGDLGLGVLVDGAIRFSPFDRVRLDLIVGPFATASGTKGHLSVWQIYGLVSYDAKLFSAGLGVGGQSMEAPTDRAVLADEDLRSAGSLVQAFRVGALDGLHVRATSHVAVLRRRFELSGLRIRTQVPLAHGLWLTPSGGGGTAGFVTGEVGLRTLVSGNGERESMFVSVSIGGTQLMRDRVYDGGVSYGSGTQLLSESGALFEFAGPHMGLGLEYRP